VEAPGPAAAREAGDGCRGCVLCDSGLDWIE
jgi:hypothetical protein